MTESGRPSLSLGDSAELELELIRRNREIAKVRDDVIKTEKRLEESTMRNDELLEKNAELDTEVNQSRNIIKNLEETVVSAKAQVETKAKEIQELTSGHVREFEVKCAKLAAQHSQECSKLSSELASAHAALEEQKRNVIDLDNDLKERNRQIASLREEASLLREELEFARKDTSSQQELQSEVERLRTQLRAQSSELQGELEVERAKLAAQHQVEVARMSAELQSVTSLLEEHRRLKQDLESQVDERERKLVSMGRDLEDTRRVGSDRAERDAQDLAQRVAELETVLAAMKTDKEESEAKCHSMGVKNAQLEREMRRAQERVVEVEGRLETQRSYMEQLTGSLNRAQGETDALRETKGALEAKLSGHTTSQQQAQEDSFRRVKELEERVARDQASNKLQSDEARQRIASLEADLRTARARSEAAERSLTNARESDDKAREREATWQKTEAELRSYQAMWRREAKDAQAELGMVKTQLEAEAGRRAAAVAAEVLAVREEARAESAKLRHAWDELRNMVKAQAAMAESADGGAAGYGSPYPRALGALGTM